MNRFPGEVERYGGSNGMKIHLTKSQLEWLRKWYPVTENKRLSKVMKIGENRVRCIAKSEGIVKSEKGMQAIRKRSARRAKATNERNGCYERKRGHAPSDATLQGVRKRWEEFHAGLRESTFETLRRRDPEKFKAFMEKRSKDRRELIEKEKRRIIYGLERKTNLKMVVMKPYTRSQLHHRCNALKRGYLLDYDCSEGTEGRYVIYYDDKTERSTVFEDNCIKDGFTFKEDR